MPERYGYIIFLALNVQASQPALALATAELLPN
jgi:hypothetical protein